MIKTSAFHFTKEVVAKLWNIWFGMLQQLEMIKESMTEEARNMFSSTEEKAVTAVYTLFAEKSFGSIRRELAKTASLHDRSIDQQSTVNTTQEQKRPEITNNVHIPSLKRETILHLIVKPAQHSADGTTEGMALFDANISEIELDAVLRRERALTFSEYGEMTF